MLAGWDLMSRRSCGNCPARVEMLASAACYIYGKLPLGEFPSDTLDMVRPDECKAKPKNQREARLRRFGEKGCAP